MNKNRRYQNERANCIIFTGNKSPDKWISSFLENGIPLCMLNRSFDAVTVFIFKRDSYKGKELKTVVLITGRLIIMQTAEEKN